MADEAFIVWSDNVIEEIHISKVTEEMQKKYTFLCNGVDLQNPTTVCKRKVFPSIKGKSTPRFTVWPNFYHIPHCSHDKTPLYKIRRFFDTKGKNVTIEDLYEAFCEPAPKRGKREKEEEVEAEEYGNGDKDEDYRRIKRIPEQIKNLKKLCELFSISELHDMYGNMQVGEIFVDHRNIVDFRKKGFQEGQPAIVLLATIGAERRNTLVPNLPRESLVFVDAHSYTDNPENPLICIVRCRTSVKDQILEKIMGKSAKKNAKKNAKNKIIAIFGKWRSDPSNPGAYICEPIYDNQFFIANKDFYEKFIT